MELKDKVITEIKKIYDPEIPVNIYDLGLIYDVKVNQENVVEIKMTLTTPNCPVAESLPKEVEDSVKGIKEVKDEKFAIIKMTLTTPNCPVAESLPKEVKEGAMQVEGIEDVNLELVWDPPWNKDMMSEAAKLELNL